MEPTTVLPTKRQGALKTSVQLTRATWRVVKLDKELLGISVVSALINILIFFVSVAAFIAWMWHMGAVTMVSDGIATAEVTIPEWSYWAAIGMYCLVTYMVSNFFNGAITYAAFRRFEGQDPTFKESIVAARAKAGPLVLFSGLQATVGLVLNVLENRLPFTGRIAVWLVGAAWGVATMFSLPVIMRTDQKNPLKVVKQSAFVFTGIWKESVFVGLSLGILSIVATILIMFVVVGLFGVAIAAHSIVVGLLGVAVLVLTVLAFAVFYNTLHAVIMTAAYYYASTGKVPAGFDEELVRAMFRPKKKWLHV